MDSSRLDASLRGQLYAGAARGFPHGRDLKAGRRPRFPPPGQDTDRGADPSEELALDLLRHGAVHGADDVDELPASMTCTGDGGARVGTGS